MWIASNKAVIAVATGMVWIAGCAHDDTPPPPRASIPPVGTYTDVRGDMPKPLPLQQPPMAGVAGYADEPIVTQAAPEQPAFVDAYARVGSPRITLFINRTLDGQIISTNTGGPVAGVETVRQTTGAVKMESGSRVTDAWGRPLSDSNSKFETSGPTEIRDKTEVYLSPGQYDEVNAKRVDYDAIENIMTDWLAANGRVTMISPTLSDSQIKELQYGNRNVLQELEKDNQIDILIQVQAKPTRQTAQGLEVRLIAEAINTMGGESIGRAVVDVPPPLDKPVINDYTRFLSRKLMSDLTRTWNNPRPQRQTAGGPPEMVPGGTRVNPPGNQPLNPPSIPPGNPPMNPPPGGTPMPIPAPPATLPTTVPGATPMATP